MNYSTILFDLDHTLFDTERSEAQAFGQAMSVAGILNADRHISTYQEINTALWSRVERGEITPQQVRILRFEGLIEALNLDVDPMHLADEFVAGLGANGDLYAGAQEVLKALSEQHSLAIITNGLGEVQWTRIKRLEIAHFFDAVVISAEVGAAKPGTDIFDLVFAALDHPPKDTVLMVGDSLSSDIQGGTNYGIATCWYNPHGKEAGPNDQITYEISDLQELHSLTVASR
jgi:2-haloacid dehalogenase